MPLEKWSESVGVVHLGDDPQLSDDLAAALDQANPQAMDLVIDFAGVHFINSSNIAKLLKLRKQMISRDQRLVLCGINTQVWGTFLVTGLDKIFEFSDNVPTALATSRTDLFVSTLRKSSARAEATSSLCRRAVEPLFTSARPSAR